MQQTFTIFRTEKFKRRKPDGTLEDFDHQSTFPGFGTNCDDALNVILEDIAECESDVLQEAFEDDAEYQFELQNAVESLGGKFQIFAGIHTSTPDATPLDEFET